MKVYVLNKDTRAYAGDLDEAAVKQFVRSVLQELRVRLKRIIPDVSVIFVSESEIQKLNKRYRQVDKVTDVLSFQAEEDGYLGDIILSKAVIASYAQQFSVSFTEELMRDILHGLMHLLGYDHEAELREGSKEEMFRIQEDILRGYQL